MLNYVPDTRCSKDYGVFFGPSTLCAGTLCAGTLCTGKLCAGTLVADGSIAAGKDSCQGNSGGPLTREEDGGARLMFGW